ncbi:MAG: helix-turn-helix domain-containing protein [Kofleriaceae bacterium]
MSIEAEMRALVRDEVRSVLREELQLALQDRAGIRNASDTYLSIANAARIASVAPGTIRAWIRAGRIEPRRAGRVLRVGREELERFLAQQPTEAVKHDIRQRADEIMGRKRARPLRRGAA